MSNTSIELLRKLIEIKPDGEDENGKFILIWNGKIHVNFWKIFAILMTLSIITILAYPKPIIYLTSILYGTQSGAIWNHQSCDSSR